MAKKVALTYKNTKVRIVGPKAFFDAYRMQSVDMPATLPNTVINELGNSRHAGTTTDIPEITTSLSLFNVDHRAFSTLTGTTYTAYPAAGVDVSSLGNCDVIMYVKDDVLNQNLKSIHAKEMRISDFTFSYSIDGESTEDYSAVGSHKRYFANDVYVETGVISASGTATLYTTPKQLKKFRDTAGDYLLSFIVDGVWKDETTSVPPTLDKYNVGFKGAGNVGFVTYSGSTNPAGNTWVAVYHTLSGLMNWNDISSGGSIPAAIRGKNIQVDIGVEQQFRVQSVTINGTFPNVAIEEMGNINVVGYIADPPDITGDISILSTDLELVALLTTGDKDDGDGYGEFNVNEYEERTLQLDIIVKSPTDNSTVLKTVRIPSMRITGDGTASNVGGQMTETYSFVSDDAQCLVFSGAAA